MPFNVGLPEMLVILVIALIVFGPRKLPEIGGAVGKAMREFRRASSELTDELAREVEVEKAQERTKSAESRPREATPYAPEQTQAYSHEPLADSSAPLLGPPQGHPGPAPESHGPAGQPRDTQGHLVETPTGRPKESRL